MRLPTVNQLKMQEKALTSQYELLNQLRIQSTTGKKLVSSSDNPILADQIKYVKNNLSQIKNYEYNLIVAEKITDEKSEIASQSLELLRNAKQILIQAQNETVNDSDRQVFANQLEGILKQFLSYANTRDENGNYIFSGISSSTAPFIHQDLGYVYQGSNENMQITIAPDNLINYTESGYNLFCAISNANSPYQATSLSTNTGTGLISDCYTIDNNSALIDNYTISFALNSQGQLVYSINGTQSGQVVPQPPSSIPDDAPLYVPGENVNFNGINYIISGSPNPGDNFSISPAKNQDVFTTIQHFINIIRKPVNTEADKVNLSQQLINIGDALEQAYRHFQSFESIVGNAGMRIDMQKEILENSIFVEEQLISNLSDADMVQVLSDLTQQMTAIQLTQEIYLKLQESFSSLLTVLRKGV
ncbi:hypothetical protein EP47_04875 [Legionella norrlandica]|uniref:Flagellin N-terminal domain-containing protein n=1 Tax=Legionella norrlandica TaxID=1498499 RepID=A0A0A2SW67_9GAMM|nr:flagellar hook-associated protein FlgL [Legionella norrlandica]KGP63699.1 hypothetical protein EP47_04875 [Legionella norrlandica]